MTNAREVFVSVDIETSGPIPGEYSLLSIGACSAFDPDNGFTVEVKPINDKFDAKALVADEEVIVLEGDWPRDKLVILSFPDEAEARRFWSSPEYLAIVDDRFAGAETTVVLAKGFVPKT